MSSLDNLTQKERDALLQDLDQIEKVLASFLHTLKVAQGPKLEALPGGKKD